MERERIVFLDWLRAIACFMVIVVHSCEPFYLGGEGTLIESLSDGLWVTFIDSMFRASVPLFVLASSYLLFPVKTDSRTFFKRRFTRVLIPLLIWSVLYTLIPLYGTENYDIIANIKQWIFNFPAQGGHLWFVYMLVGIYLLMPMISPWAEKLSKKDEEIFIALWAVTTVLPLLRPLAANMTGGNAQMYGEASWNEFGAFYYVSGFVGYVMLGHYFRRWVKEMSWGRTLAYALPCLVFGYLIVAGGFFMRMPRNFPVEGPIDIAVYMEMTWCFATLGVALQTVGYFLIIRKFSGRGKFYEKVVLPLSKMSYGMYLMHIFILVPVFSFVGRWIASWGVSAVAATPLTIVITAFATYISAFAVTKLISFIPKSKYLIG